MAEVGCLKDGNFHNLQVENFPTGGGLGELASIDTTVRTTAFTAQHNTTYILGDTGANTVVIALESPAVGAVINFIVSADLHDSGQWTIGTAGAGADCGRECDCHGCGYRHQLHRRCQLQLPGR